MVEALREKNIPVAYVLFEGEGHGFRQAANVRQAFENELSFYAQVFDFRPPARLSLLKSKTSRLSREDHVTRSDTSRSVHSTEIDAKFSIQSI